MDEKKKSKSSSKKKPVTAKPKVPKKRVKYTQRTQAEAQEIRTMALALIPETEEQKAEREKREQEEAQEVIHGMLEKQAKNFGITYERNGRPSKFSEIIVQKLLTAIAIGCTYTESANYAGIHVRTLYNYFTEYPDFSTLCETLRTKTPLKARRVVNYYLDQVVKKVEAKQEISVDDFKMAYGYLKDRYPQEFSKGVGGGMLKGDDEVPTAPVQITNNTVNMVFSNTLGRSQFLRDIPPPQNPSE